MPTVVTEGRFQFKVNLRENDYEPPHVHVWVHNDDVCRINLDNGEFLDNPPPGDGRAIVEVYARHAEEIRKCWDETHKR